MKLQSGLWENHFQHPVPRAAITRGMESLDEVDLMAVFERRAVVMRTACLFERGFQRRIVFGIG